MELITSKSISTTIVYPPDMPTPGEGSSPAQSQLIAAIGADPYCQDLKKKIKFL